MKPWKLMVILCVFHFQIIAPTVLSLSSSLDGVASYSILQIYKLTISADVFSSSLVLPMMAERLDLRHWFLKDQEYWCHMGTSQSHHNQTLFVLYKKLIINCLRSQILYSWLNYYNMQECMKHFFMCCSQYWYLTFPQVHGIWKI